MAARKGKMTKMEAGVADQRKELSAINNAPNRKYIVRSPELEQQILNRLAGGESLLRICRDDNMPNRATVMAWVAGDSDFATQYWQAHQYNAMFLVETMLDVAEGGELSTGDMERDKLKVNVLKWMASKYNRTAFGDQVDVKHSTDTIQINLPREFDDPDIVI